MANETTPTAYDFDLFAPLTLASRALVGYKLTPYFTIQEIDRYEILNIISEHQGKSSESEAELHYNCFDHSRGAGLVLRGKRPIDGLKETVNWLRHYRDIENVSKRLTSDIDNAFRKMKIFHDGNIVPLAWYWSMRQPKEKSPTYYISRRPHYVGDFYGIKDEAINKLSEFMDQTVLPFKHDYLNLALESYEDAYTSNKQHMQFLSLIICLEALFNTGPTDTGYKVTRCAATLAGDDQGDAIRILDELRAAYTARNDLVHKGESKKINEALIKSVRRIARKCLYFSAIENDSKAALFKKLTLSALGGFRSVH